MRPDTSWTSIICALAAAVCVIACSMDIVRALELREVLLEVETQQLTLPLAALVDTGNLSEESRTAIDKQFTRRGELVEFLLDLFEDKRRQDRDAAFIRAGLFGVLAVTFLVLLLVLERRRPLPTSLGD